VARGATKTIGLVGANAANAGTMDRGSGRLYVRFTMPYGIYTIPEVSSYGENEESCQTKGIPYVVGRSLYANNPWCPETHR
jgi:pyruvate/2-oxoglutarate dehydrogenase complex dihydrolipoamide dehydrogenase (E3) component